MDNNNLQGAMPSEVCDNRVSPGVLEVLTVDCLGAPNRESPPFVACPDTCCTECF